MSPLVCIGCLSIIPDDAPHVVIVHETVTRTGERPGGGTSQTSTYGVESSDVVATFCMSCGSRPDAVWARDIQ